jgi:hypothetical protein
MACYGDSCTLLSVYDVRTSQETNVRASTICYGDSFTFLHVNDVRPSQETRVLASYTLLLYMLILFIAIVGFHRNS